MGTSIGFPRYIVKWILCISFSTEASSTNSTESHKTVSVRKSFLLHLNAATYYITTIGIQIQTLQCIQIHFGVQTIVPQCDGGCHYETFSYALWFCLATYISNVSGFSIPLVLQSWLGYVSSVDSFFSSSLEFNSRFIPVPLGSYDGQSLPHIETQSVRTIDH